MSLIAGAINPLNSDRTTASMEEAARSRLDAIENSKISGEDPAIRAAAEDFEAAFISQMLKFSGLGKALTTGGAKMLPLLQTFIYRTTLKKSSRVAALALRTNFMTN